MSLLSFLQKLCNRDPDVIIGGKDDPYLYRWFVIPRNPIFNIYLHKFLRSDDDRALHDHPWWNCSRVLYGHYFEHLPNGVVKTRRPGKFYFRGAKQLHRIELDKGILTGREMSVWTLFITGPRFRTWGFQCPKGWIPWQQFTTDDGSGNQSGISKGCGEYA